jgi:dihydrofolate reductase
MRKIVAGFASSVDGYIEGENGEYDWILIDKEIDFTEHMKRFDAYFFGRKSYEAIMRMNSGNATPGATNYVFSNTLKSVDKNYVLINGDIEKRINDIRSKEGKDIAIFGGANLLASLLNIKVVDEVIISIIPVLLGKGKPMVSELKNKVWLSPTKHKRYNNGTIQVFYEVKYENLSS